MRRVRSEAEAAAALREFETSHQLFALAVEGCSVWRLVRFPVGLALQNLPLEQARLPRLPLLAALFRSLADLVRLPKGNRYAVKSYVSALRIPGEAGYEDIYFERLLSGVTGGVRLHSFNAAGYGGRSGASASRSVDTTAVLVVGTVLAKLFPVKGGDAVFSRLSGLLSDGLGVQDFPASRIRRMFSSFRWQSHLYAWLLQRLGVKTVFAADTGERALLSACRRQGGRFVELQHGIFTPDHPDSLPASVVDEANEASLLLPDVLALYGDYWRARHAGTALGRSGRLLCAGASVIESFRALRNLSFHASARCPKLLVTTQGIDREALIRFLSEFLAASGEPFELVVKLHPANDRSVLPYARGLGSDPRVRIIGGGEDPNTYELIALADVHLSIASACHFDALGIGVPTAVIGLAGYQLVQDLVDCGDALLVREPVELAAMVSRRSWAPVAESISSKYYRYGFVENLQPLIV